MSKPKPVEQREHRIKPTLVDIESYKKREIPQLTGRFLKTQKFGGMIFGKVIYLVQ